MPKLIYHKKVYYFICKHSDRDIPKKADFRWDDKKKIWYAPDRFIAYKLKEFAETNAQHQFDQMDLRVKKTSSSHLTRMTHDAYTQGLRNIGYYNYQALGSWLLQHLTSGILADEMGLGKSAQALGVISILGHKKVLIVCPASLKDNWLEEAQKWLVDKLNFQVIGTGKDVIKSDCLIINYRLLDNKKLFKALTDMKFDYMIVDEAHYLKNPESNRTRKVLGYTNTRGRPVYHMGLKDIAAQRVFLTGTLIPNKSKEVFALLSAVAPETISNMNYFQFTRRFCNGHDGEWGWDDNGASNLDELKLRLKSTILIRRLKKDVLEELPDKTLQIIKLNSANKEISYDTNEFNKFKMEMCLDEISEIRRELAFEKLEASIDYIKNVMENTDKIIIFAHHTDIVKCLEMALWDYKPLKIYGATSVKKRLGIVKQFQENPEHRIIIGNLQAMGTGFNITISCNVIFVEFSWVPGENEQCIDRVHRIGQKRNVLARFLVQEGTMEAHMIKRLLEKKKVIKQILD